MKNILKVKTYVGFAIKSRAIVYGVDSIKDSKVYVVIYAENLSGGSKFKLLESLKDKNCHSFQISIEEMNEIFNNSNIKAFAIKSNELANAIIENL